MNEENIAESKTAIRYHNILVRIILKVTITGKEVEQQEISSVASGIEKKV